MRLRARTSLLTIAGDASDPNPSAAASGLLGPRARVALGPCIVCTLRAIFAHMTTSDNIWSFKDSLGEREKRPVRETDRPRKVQHRQMDKLPLPDLYLIDSRKLLAEITRIRGLALAIPASEAGHSATQSVVDALWHLEGDMQAILRVQASIHRSFAEKAEALERPSEPVRFGLRVIS